MNHHAILLTLLSAALFGVKAGATLHPPGSTISSAYGRTFQFGRILAGLAIDVSLNGSANQSQPNTMFFISDVLPLLRCCVPQVIAIALHRPRHIHSVTMAPTMAMKYRARGDGNNSKTTPR